MDTPTQASSNAPEKHPSQPVQIDEDSNAPSRHSSNAMQPDDEDSPIEIFRSVDLRHLWPKSPELQARGERLIASIQLYRRENNLPNNRSKTEDALMSVWAVIRKMAKEGVVLPPHSDGIQGARQEWLKDYIAHIGDENYAELFAFNAECDKED